MCARNNKFLCVCVDSLVFGSWWKGESPDERTERKLQKVIGSWGDGPDDENQRTHQVLSVFYFQEASIIIIIIVRTWFREFRLWTAFTRTANRLAKMSKREKVKRDHKRQRRAGTRAKHLAHKLRSRTVATKSTVKVGPKRGEKMESTSPSNRPNDCSPLSSPSNVWHHTFEIVHVTASSTFIIITSVFLLDVKGWACSVCAAAVTSS